MARPVARARGVGVPDGRPDPPEDDPVHDAELEQVLRGDLDPRSPPPRAFVTELRQRIEAAPQGSDGVDRLLRASAPSAAAMAMAPPSRLRR